MTREAFQLVQPDANSGAYAIWAERAKWEVAPLLVLDVNQSKAHVVAYLYVYTRARRVRGERTARVSVRQPDVCGPSKEFDIRLDGRRSWRHDRFDTTQVGAL